MKILGYLLLMTGFSFAGELRVVSYNIHHGQGMDGKLDLPRIAKVIEASKPDFVALQEVDKLVPRSGKVDQAAELAKLLGMHQVFGKCIDLDGGGYGNAVLSKHPILESHIHRLPGKGEARAALEIITQVDGKKLSFVSIHLDWTTDEERLKQAQAMEKALTERKHPVIMLGDFNARPESKTMALIGKNWSIIPKTGERLTSPANKPRGEIDYLITRGLDTTKAACQVGEEKVASDHRPLTGTLTFP